MVDNKPNPINETLIEKKRREISNLMAPIFEDIEKYPIPHGVIREEFFVSVFLPYFAGELKESEFPNGISMHTWNQIAGNMNNYVDVVDANGNILYTVPPVTDLSYIVQDPSTHYTPMASVGAYAETLRNSARPDEAQMADRVLSKELNNRLPARLKDKKDERYREWAKIFLRYGYFLPENENTDTPDVENTPDLLDDLDWS